jgi:hypothetical protein
MHSFYVIFSILAVLALLDLFEVKKRQRSILLMLTTLMLILFAGLRYGMPDYQNYVDMFHAIRKAGYQGVYHNVDIGYRILNMLVGSVFAQPLSIFIIMAALTVWLNVKCYNQYARYVFMALLFHFVNRYISSEMMQIRSALAYAICLYNFRNIADRRWFRFAFFQVLALSMHLGSILFLAAPVLQYINLSRRVWTLALLVCVIVGVFYPLGNFLLKLPSNEYTVRALGYVQSEYHTKLGIFHNFATLKQMLMCALGLIFYGKLNQTTRYFPIMFACYVFATCWLIAWNDFAIIAARGGAFLSIAESILIAQLLSLGASRSSRCLIAVILIAAALTMLMYRLSGGEIIYQLNPILSKS